MRVGTTLGLVTLFYDGSRPLYDDQLDDEWNDEYIENADDDDDAWKDWDLSDECKCYWEERQMWQLIIIEEGVTEIPNLTFARCFNVLMVIFPNTVTRIEDDAFRYCERLGHITLSRTLVYIGAGAFAYCDLSSVYIPPLCRGIAEGAFACNANLTILHVPHNTDLAEGVIDSTKLLEYSPFEVEEYEDDHLQEINVWMKNINNDEKSRLHRVCCSFQPSLNMILDAVEEMGGLKAFKVENSIGVTPSKYLRENPFAEVTEKEIIEKYIMKMMGEL